MIRISIALLDHQEQLPNMFENLSEDLRKALNEAGYIKPTRVQEVVIPELMNGKSVIVQAKTGSGKTAAYVIPILERNSTALILSPTRELATQILDEIKKLGKYKQIDVSLIIGGMSYDDQRQSKIVVGTPGRLLDLWSKGKIDFSGYDFVIVDEADRMLDMGFIDDIRMILNHCNAKIAGFFSATIPDEIMTLAKEFSKDLREIVLDEYKPVEEVKQKFVKVRNDWNDKVSKLLEEINGEKILVFARTRDRARKLYYLLKGKGVNVGLLSGDMPQSVRLKNFYGFKKGKYNVLVATDLASRGIDIIDVNKVINFDIPRDVETYIHRVGRTGRMGRVGQAITFYTFREADMIKRINNLLAI
ncbi:DEAD/DEAH box helicase domain protein [Sulfolobus islandicus Y.G.57.14]|jgi:Superfamily II DNA and RNA helicases|uniref:ATP-dependent RNA helicase n=5 Tax=Saccharolobus TaxID=2100760 RepID=Q97WT0_SACS2|nr:MULTISPECIES: DEAD/DEAH box helicase [Sulfolobaceae]PVU77419.1 ATP-dependent helicase [Sulfolobus islandicus]AAK42222.1 ATP-dependent RNA helicase [Saccharolobus solfataricus P2]ACP45261.1 DEAD/DEAH box helicase domain protein [Sulfolobus islandicus Y.G.57.14]ACR41354.1 DEAD/DEAH box helicase domain protein [Sulfolobus islandicus M.16.4]ADB86484.1 DEAD/DEAH box helicase domain protein [Sulfolobus islandicus L.D.8.5]